MDNKKYDIFISYSRKDSKTVNKFVALFEQQGYSVWVDREGIPYGAEFVHEIVSAINQSRLVVFFSSKNSNSSSWTVKEIGTAIDKGKNIIPVKIDSSDYNDEVKFYLIHNNFVDCSNLITREAQTKELLKALARHLGSENKSKVHDKKAKRKITIGCSLSVVLSLLVCFIVFSLKYSPPSEPPDVVAQSAPSDDCPTQDVMPIDVAGCKMIMIRVPKGSFEMGGTSEQMDCASNQLPVHHVTIDYDYYIGETEVTQQLWDVVIGDGDTHINPNHPVSNVSWDDCMTFVDRLNKMTGLHFSLPLEAEWEYAARGCKSNLFRFAGSDNLSDVAWYADNGNEKVHQVKMKSPNQLGLYDMSGNVWEWCLDWRDTYEEITYHTPFSTNHQSIHGMRGGGYKNDERGCQTAFRLAHEPDYKTATVGLRLVLHE